MSGDVEPWARAAVLFRADGRCEWCGIRITRPEVHHRLYRSRGGGHDPANLVALCGWGNTTGCHGRAHGATEGGEADAVAAGITIPRGGDPLAVPFRSVIFQHLVWIDARGDQHFEPPDRRP